MSLKSESRRPGIAKNIHKSYKHEDFALQRGNYMRPAPNPRRNVINIWGADL